MAHSHGRAAVLLVITLTYMELRVAWTSHRSQALTRPIDDPGHAPDNSEAKPAARFTDRRHDTVGLNSGILTDHSVLFTVNVQHSAFNATGLHNLLHVVDGVRAHSTVHSTFGSIRYSCILGMINMIVIHFQLAVLYGDPALGRSTAKNLHALARWPKARIMGKGHRAQTVVRADLQRSAAQFHDPGSLGGA